MRTPWILLAWLLLSVSLPAQTPCRRVWRGTFWGAPAHRVEVTAPGLREVSLSLDGFPYRFTSRLEVSAAMLTQIDANGHLKTSQGLPLQEAITLYWVESGQWRPYYTAGHLQAPGGLPAQLSLNDRGDPQTLTYNSGAVQIKVTYEDYVDRNGVHTFQRRVQQSSYLHVPEQWDLEEVGPDVSLGPLHDTPSLVFPGRPEGLLSLWMHFPLISGTMGSRPLNFLLDTGSASSILDAGVAAELGLPVAGHQAVSSRWLEGDVGFARTGPLQLLGVTWEPQTLTRMELKKSHLAENLCEFDGTLGWDVLSRVVLQLDYPAGRIRFFPRDGFTPAPDDRAIPCRLEGSLPFVEVRLNGRSSYLLLDTGCPNVALAAQAPGLVPPQEERFYEPDGVQFAIGSASGWPGRADLEVGPFRWARAPIAVIDSPTARGPVVAGPGVLGGRFLENFRVTLDLATPRLWLAQRLPFRQGPGGSYGFQLEWQHARLLVRSLAPQGPAGQAGLQLGDRVVSLNGLVPGPGSAVSVVLDQPVPGEKLELEVERGGELHRLRVEAAPLP